ncbi:MAG: hypothetical protein ABSF31_13565 [Steroidobacteraceae bacterium]|jgi:hypothetical protein
MNKKKQKPLLPNTVVTVRPLKEILLTLDKDGTLEALPFMPEMAKYCGKRFTVSKRLERTCEESEKGMRRIQNVVFLDNLRCNGVAHGGCQKGCRIFWKESWLVIPETDTDPPVESPDDDALVAQLPFALPGDRYICQSTELVNATTPLSSIDLMCYVRDIHSKTYSIPELLRVLSYAFFLRLRYYLTGTPFNFLRGKQVQTPLESLNLQPGEWVQVKTKEEIRHTLDISGMNRGLRFTSDMLSDCGKTYRVLSRLEKMIHEPKRKLITLRDTVILDYSVCKGCHIIKGGCPRENFNFWREIWLRRIPPA